MSTGWKNYAITNPGEGFWAAVQGGKKCYPKNYLVQQWKTNAYTVLVTKV